MHVFAHALHGVTASQSPHGCHDNDYCSCNSTFHIVLLLLALLAATGCIVADRKKACKHCAETSRTRGILSYQAESTIDLPCVGDWVVVQYYDDGASAVIHEVLPRKTFLRRKAPGARTDFQMIAANIDIAFIVQSCRFDFNPRRLDR